MSLRVWRSAGHAMPLVLIPLVMGLLACTPEESGDPVGPNFVLLSIDTLRADHLGCYGYERDTSPNIDRFAANSIRYADAYAPAPWTLPSHAAMLTGRHPYDLGIWDLDSSIPEDVPLLAEVLRDAGYQTAGFVDSLDAGLVGANRGFGRGFEAFYHSPHGAPSDYKYDVARTFEAGFNWLTGRDPRKPFFLFLHTKSVHTAPYVKNNLRQGDAPYDHPGRESFRYLPTGELQFSWQDRDGNRGVRYLRETNEQLARGEFDRADLPEAKIEELVGLYDGGIHYVDREFQGLIQFLASQGLAENTVVILTSDHGEGFLEHEFLLHQEVYRQLLHVPLIVHDPALPKGRVVGASVSLQDIMASVLARAGVDSPGGDIGLPLPVDDVPADAAATDRNLFSFYRFDKISLRRAFSLKSPELRLIIEPSAEGEPGRHRYFDLTQDPDELRPLEGPGEAGEKMLAELLERIERGGVAEGVKIELDDENIERLRALGYVE